MQIKSVKKVLVLITVAAAVSLLGSGCKSQSKQTHDEHPKAEHPKAEHPK